MLGFKIFTLRSSLHEFRQNARSPYVRDLSSRLRVSISWKALDTFLLHGRRTNMFLVLSVDCAGCV